MSNPGTSITARLVAVIGGAFATLSAIVIHQTAALPLSLALDLAPILGAEVVIPWAASIGLVLLGWIPAFLPRTGWLIGVAVFILGGLALIFANLGGYVIGTASAFVAAALFFAAANTARRARKAAKARARMPANDLSSFG